MQIGVHQRTYALVTLHLPSYFISISPILSLSKLWWSTSTVNILSLILLVEGHLPFFVFYFSLFIHRYDFVVFCLLPLSAMFMSKSGGPIWVSGFLQFLKPFVLFSFRFLLLFFLFGRGGYLYVYFSSIVVEITILRCRIRVLVLGFECQNHKILVFY